MAEQDTLNQVGSQESNANPSLTPTDAFSGPNEGQAQQTDTASDVFGEVFGTQQAQEAPPQDAQPDVPAPTQPQPGQPVADVSQEAPKDNDQVRYQYWQSQASKAQNQLKEMQQYVPYIDYIKNNPEAILGAQQQQQPQTAEEAFPKAPEKPRKPRGFSREDALSDTNSDSARYLDDLDEWQDKIVEYNQLQSEYTNAKLQETMQEMQAREQRVRQAQQAEASRQQQLGEINEFVIANHGLNQEQASRFIQDMSSPESITMDNLVQLWMAKEGLQSTPQQQVAQPSAQFQQTQTAQQVPTPMGVIPGGQGQGGNAEDQMMDAMLTDYKSRNPF